MKKLLNFLSLIILLNAHASYCLSNFFNQTHQYQTGIGSIAALTKYAHYLPKIKTFDPKNKKHHAQVLKLLTEEKEFLLSPAENPELAMQEYMQGMQTISSDTDPCAGLIMKVVLANKNKMNDPDVIGFSTFVPDKYKINLRTIAVDPKYRGKGIATGLLQDIESETKKKKLSAILCVVYSHNDVMLHLMEKHGYTLWEQKGPAFYKQNLHTQEITTVYSNIFVKQW